jgi:hypothetical protein
VTWNFTGPSGVAYMVPFFTAIVSISRGYVQSIAWETVGCGLCAKDACSPDDFCGTPLEDCFYSGGCDLKARSADTRAVRVCPPAASAPLRAAAAPALTIRPCTDVSGVGGHGRPGALLRELRCVRGRRSGGGASVAHAGWLLTVAAPMCRLNNQPLHQVLAPERVRECCGLVRPQRAATREPVLSAPLLRCAAPRRCAEALVVQ